MNSQSHRIAIARRFGVRIAAGDAVFQSGAASVAALPFTETDGHPRQFSGANLFVLMQAMASIEAAGRNGVMVVPSFQSLSGRPTDWNDLYKREGIERLMEVARRQGLAVPAMHREKVPRGVGIGR